MYITNWYKKHRYFIFNCRTNRLLYTRIFSYVIYINDKIRNFMRRYYKIIVNCFGTPLDYAKLIYGNTKYAYNVASRIRNCKYKFKSRQEKILLVLCEKQKNAGFSLNVSEINKDINDNH